MGNTKATEDGEKEKNLPTSPYKATPWNFTLNSKDTLDLNG